MQDDKSSHSFSPINKKGKILKPDELNSTSFGFVLSFSQISLTASKKNSFDLTAMIKVWNKPDGLKLKV